MEKILPSLISSNQSGFIKWRSIFENILLTQEIVTDIRLRGKPANVVIKLVMAKAYDRVSWKYLMHVLRKMGFAECFINMIWNLISNNCVSSTVSSSIGTITEFIKGEFPFTYLGCPIFYTGRRKDYYNDLMKNVKAKLHSWKGKLLSYGGKSTLISSVLQSMPMHILSVIDPPNNVIEQLHKAFVRFFWSTKEEGRSRHWTKWQILCLPKEEGGVGFRSHHDVSKALFAKFWWKFRTSNSLWSNFMWNKYCKKEIPTTVQFRQGSHVWRKMLEAREEVEHEILREMNRGSTNVWHENWTDLGALYHIVPNDYTINEDMQEVAELRVDDTWDEQLLAQSFPADNAQHIRQEVIFGTTDDS
nr:uncharacterized protein LOC104092031 [Nicotiana tomentosiformis]